MISCLYDGIKKNHFTEKCEVVELYLLTHCKCNKVRIFCEFLKINFETLQKNFFMQ